ncbi:MAG: RNA-guided endonuclease TnpB family protein [Acinetobacter towneri]|uniref:RNA-guided endonuclease TnpB family protein n=2 Tax=Acinetobacter TaxID=469 RepID=UPI000BDA2C30|nr:MULTISPECIES: RNA-guided endonuclease TnpB family protein [unclassified Acinetobacter]MBT0886115.1 transposase [Acinetobacter towneri]NWJ91522.1 IS200/IS605 family element transposase accessory protein TnpB [Acinetobacter sp. Swhac1]PCN61641.1 transposase [Acinetobacter sp. YT-02]UIZ58652.1 transposase [Acinetobacter sp. SCLZS86]
MNEAQMKAYKYRIYPNGEQKVLIEKHFGCARFTYNWALALQQKYYDEHKKSLSRKDIQDQLVSMKKQEQYSWLNEVNSQTLLSGLLHVYTAFGNFFKGRAKFPKFKSKKIPQRSYQCPQHGSVDFEKGTLNLPKLKGIKAVFSRQFDGKIKTVTISKTATGKYYASILVETNQAKVTASIIESDKTIGIDLGLNHLLIQSDGQKIENPKYLRQAQKRLAIQQKIFARKKKESKNYQRQKLNVACIYEKVRLQRLDLHHKLTHHLICENQATTYAVEDLGIKNMVKNSKLAKSISDVAWGQFLTLLQYKAEWYGKNVLKIGRFVPSSKTCSCCGYKMEKLPLSVRLFECPSCNLVEDRDVNASINIRNFALADALGLRAV